MTDKQIEALERRIQPKVEKFFHGVSRSIHTSTIFIAELIAVELTGQRKADKERYIAAIGKLKREEEYINMERADDPSYTAGQEYNEALHDVVKAINK